MIELTKLCLVIPSLQAGGMERVLSILSKYFMRQENLEIHLILYGITREVFYEISDKIIIHTPRFKFNNRFRFYHTIRTALFIRQTIKKVNPGKILSFGEYWNSLILISLYGLDYSIFVSDRCQPDKSLGKIHDFLRKVFYPKATQIIVQTEKAASIYNHNYGFRNLIVIANPIRLIPPDESVKKENIVLMVGRIIQTKHQDKLIEIFLQIRKPGWKLVIVGYDHLKQDLSTKLNKIINSAHAEEIVSLEGKQVNVDSYYLKSKVFAFTSSSEGFPNVIGEAMSAGLPVVAFDCIAGPSEMIQDCWNGFLVPLFDYALFKYRLEQLMDSETLRIAFGERARESVKKFSIDNIGKKYLDLLTKSH